MIKIKKSEQIESKIERYKFYLKGILALESRLDSNPFSTDDTEMSYTLREVDNSFRTDLKITLSSKKASSDYYGVEMFSYTPMITATISLDSYYKNDNIFYLYQGDEMVFTTSICSIEHIVKFRKFIDELCKDIVVE
jgi:hypothetical protein